MYLFVLLVTWITFHHSSAACSTPKYNKFGSSHTMCLASKKCSPGKTLLETTFDEYERMALVHLHNKLRGLVANGHIPGQPPAKNMNQLAWDEELAIVAHRWAEQCTFQHDTNRKVDRFIVGQNLAYEWWYPPLEGRSAIAVNSTIAMFNEVALPGFPASQVENFQVVKGTGHYTQIVWAETSLIGCGKSAYTEVKNEKLGKTTLIVCNFGKGGNVITRAVYEVGQPQCAVFSDNYKGLCATKEVNKAFKNPCENGQFKILYPALCDDELFSKLGIYGSPGSPHGSSGRQWWKTLLLSALFMMLAGALSGSIYFAWSKFCKRNDTFTAVPTQENTSRRFYKV